MSEPEIFDIIHLLNKLYNEFKQLNKRIEFILKNPHMIVRQNVIDEKTACRLYKLSHSTLWRLRNAEKLPYSELNGRIYYLVKDLDDIFKNNVLARPPTIYN